MNLERRKFFATKAESLMGNPVPESDTVADIKKRIRFFLRVRGVTPVLKGQCQKQPGCTSRTRNGKPLRGRYDHNGRLKQVSV